MSEGEGDLRQALHDARNEAQVYLGERDEALADLKAAEKRADDLSVVRDWYVEVHKELDKQGAPPGALAHQRLREMVRGEKVSREQVADALGAREALERALDEIQVMKTALAEGEAHRQRLEAQAREGRPRRKVDRERLGLTHHFSVGGHDGYVIVNFFEDGSPGEFFVKIAKQGSTMSGLLDTCARLASKSLQHGTPLLSVCWTLVGQSFEPRGSTVNPEIPFAESIADYVGKWLVKKFIPAESWTAYAAMKSGKKRKLALLDGEHAGGAE